MPFTLISSTHLHKPPHTSTHIRHTPRAFVTAKQTLLRKLTPALSTKHQITYCRPANRCRNNYGRDTRTVFSNTVRSKRKFTLHTRLHTPDPVPWGARRCKAEIRTRITLFVFHDAAAPSGPSAPHYRGFTITLKHATFGTTPLAE